MAVYSPVNIARPTLIALDNDPQRRPFEFCIEVKPTRLRINPRDPLGASIGVAASPLGWGPLGASFVLAAADSGQPLGSVACGVFFGWHRNPQDPEQRRFHFVVCLTEPGAFQAQPRLDVFLECCEEGKPPRAIYYHTVSCFPAGQGPLTLAPLAPGGWRRLSVKAFGDKVEITVDRLRPLAFAVSELKTIPPSVRAGLSTRGALGVWVQRGYVHYRQAFVTAILSEEK
jgi:hypothetical protein